MLLCALRSPFPRTFIIKGNANKERNPPSCRFSVIALINEKPRVVSKNIHRCRKLSSHRCDHSAKRFGLLFFVSCFTVSVARSINGRDFFSGSTILIISSTIISSYISAGCYRSLSSYFSFKFI